MTQGRNAQARWAGCAAAAIALTLLAAGCRGGTSTPAGNAAPASPPAATNPVFGTFGIDLRTRKTAVKPGDDFFAYVNGS